MLVFGVIDDLTELSVPVKFLTQFIAAGVLVSGGVRLNLVGIGDAPNILLTLLWVVGLTNAFNHLDVMDGVAAACAFTAIAGLAAVSWFSGDIRLSLGTLVLLSCVAAFLPFNLPPARAYLGNAGSHFIGFCVAAVCLQARYAPDRISLAVFAPLCICAFPILDTLFLIAMRLAKRKSIFRKSNDHIVLRLRQAGLSRQSILAAVFSVSAVFSLLGVAAVRVPEPLVVAMLLAFVSLCAALLWKVSHIEVKQ